MNSRIPVLALLCCCACGSQDATQAASPELKTGVWRVVMQSPGGELPFKLNIDRDGDRYTATGFNAAEAVHFDTVSVETTGAISFGIDHYESVFLGQLNASGERIEGEWSKVSGHDRLSRLPFTAQWGQEQRFNTDQSEPAEFGGRWAVTFNNEGQPEAAVAEFVQEGAHIKGTFLTPVGDYRYLEGNVAGKHLWLSCFDGGHAFLFTAAMGEDGMLSGQFWSKDTWHDTWTAKRDDQAALPDAYSLTSVRESDMPFHFSFSDLDGVLVNQDDPWLKGKVRLVTIFGSWCPNCNDEAPFLQSLKNEYGDRGLEVLGLAFEMTKDQQRNIKVLKRFQKRHNLDYRILLAGTSTNKAKAAETLPDLNHVLSFPTTLLINREGKIDSIHTGFSGPGTGSHHDDLVKSYRKRIERLL